MQLRGRRKRQIRCPDVLAKIAAAHPVNICSREGGELGQYRRVIRRADGLIPLDHVCSDDGRSRNRFREIRDHGPRRYRGSDGHRSKLAWSRALGLLRQWQGKFELHIDAGEVWIGKLVAIQTGCVHGLHPLHLAFCLSHWKDATLQRLLAFQPKPVFHCIVFEIGGKRPGQALDTALPIFGAGRHQTRLHGSAEREKIASAFLMLALLIGPTQRYGGVRGRLIEEPDAHTSILPIARRMNHGYDAAGITQGAARF